MEINNPKIIFLEEIINMNNKIDDEIKFYEGVLAKVEFRLSVRQEEKRQLLELLDILENERNK